MVRIAIFGFIASFALIAGNAHQDAQSDAADSADAEVVGQSVIDRADLLGLAGGSPMLSA